MVRFGVNDYVSGLYLLSKYLESANRMYLIQKQKIRHGFGLIHLNMDVYSTLNYNWGKRQKIEYLHIIYYFITGIQKMF